MLRVLGIWVCWLLALGLMAQETVVIGRVFSAIDKMPVSAVNIIFSGTKNGTQTDDDGFFVLKNQGSESKIVFSCIGYKTRELKIEAGRMANVEIELQEDVNILQDLFVVPGANPALEILKKVRAKRLQNDLVTRGATLLCQEDNLAMLRKSSYGESNNKFFGQLATGMISPADSTVFLPLYMSRDQYLRTGKMPPSYLKREAKASPENLKDIFDKMTGDLTPDMNFYNNNVNILGKSFISPLSVSGISFYRYFLIDSVQKSTGKQYYIRYKSKNSRNLAFNGDLWIDSTTFALTALNAEVPAAANLNYVDRLSISKSFRLCEDSLWCPDSEQLTIRMNYLLKPDSVTVIPGFYLHRTVKSQLNTLSGSPAESFAGSEFSKDDIELKLAEMNDLPLMKTARWIADVVLTSYMKAGHLDVGKVYQFARISEVEGFRFNIPLRTNETLWENLSIGGYWGYGTLNRKHNYLAEAFLRLPFNQKTVLGAGIADDLRRIDYDYTDLMPRENPLVSGDEDFSATIFGFRPTDKLHRRKEFFVSLMHDWNDNIESTLFYRNNNYEPGKYLPFAHPQEQITAMNHQFLLLSTRFSINERTYEDHLQRIYVQNYKPVLYVNLEAGKTVFSGNTNFYGKLSLKVRQNVLFGFGQWRYNADAGILVGKVPYNLLFIAPGSESALYKRYSFNLMDYMEYGFDRYFSMHHELFFNGIILNHIPLVNKLNLREMISFKFLYGGLYQQDPSMPELPATFHLLPYPYMEAGAGITNVFRILSLQAIWRLTDRDRAAVRKMEILAGIRVVF